MEIPPIVKEKWPWFLGGAVGIFLVVRYMGGGASSSNASQDYRGYLASYSAAQTAAAQTALQQDANDKSYSLQMASLQASSDAASAASYNDFIAAQGSVAQGIAAAASGVILALNTPAQQAIASGSAENAAALEAAANVAVGSFQAQALTTTSTASMIDSIAKVPFATSAADTASVQNRQPSLGSQLINAAAYVTGGGTVGQLLAKK